MGFLIYFQLITHLNEINLVNSIKPGKNLVHTVTNKHKKC